MDGLPQSSLNIQSCLDGDSLQAVRLIRGSETLEVRLAEGGRATPLGRWLSLQEVMADPDYLVAGATDLDLEVRPGDEIEIFSAYSQLVLPPARSDTLEADPPPPC